MLGGHPADYIDGSNRPVEENLLKCFVFDCFNDVASLCKCCGYAALVSVY